MTKSKKFLFSLSLFTCLATTGFAEISESPLEVNLKDPEFSNGQISTDKGGIITMGNLRIQAQKIEYVNKIENGEHVQKIIAEENLLLEYDKQFFVGSKLEYDLTKKKGTIWDGKTFTGAWFVGGDKIELEEDGTLYIHNAYITTSENQEKTWHIDASQIKISSTQILTADNIQVRFIKIPLFWFPKVKTNLKAFSSSPLRYKLTWDKNLGPKISMRYQVFASDYSDVYARLDYRGKNRFGGAIESEYYSEDGRGSFLTKNYVAHDKLVPDEHGYHRHRFQGLLHAQSKNDKTFLDISWDQMTDNKMPGDFKSDDFEVNTEKRTLFRLQHNEPLAVSSLRIQPRVNTFQSVNQQLPLAAVGVHPFSFGSSGIIANNNFEVSYLDYIYAKDLSPDVTNFYGGRLSTKNELYRPIPIKYFTLTPKVGYTGIFYSTTPTITPYSEQFHTIPASNPVSGHDKMQSIFYYGVDANTRMFHSYSKYRHMVEPYILFQGMTHPTAKLDDHYIFSLEDGYVHMDMIKAGVRNSLYRKSQFTPTFDIDLYTYAFFHEVTYPTTIPKAYTSFAWNLPNLHFNADLCYNIAENVLDYSNFASSWTINAHLALILEYRHRSKYDWRKSDRENFVIDFARPLEELLSSPISDGRNTFITKMSARLSPRWTVLYENCIGWGRRNEPMYNSLKVELSTLLATHWRAKVGFEHLPNDDRFTWGILLIK